MVEKKHNNANRENRVHVMPQSLYGVKVKEKPRSKQPVAAKVLPKRTPKPVMKAPPVIKETRTSLVTMVVLGLGIILILVLGGWLTYLNFFAPAPEPVVPSVVVVPPAVIVPKDEPAVVPPVEPEVAPTVEPDLEPIVPEAITLDSLSTVDTDADGLTDAEEVLLGTDEALPDTDADGFLDGEEVVNLYNPLGTDPARLEFTDLVSTYVNPIRGYDIFYPRKWIARALDQSSNEVYFTSSVGEFVSVTTHDNTEQVTLTAWLLAENPDLTIDDLETFTSELGLDGIKLANGFSVYYSLGSSVYELTYNVGLRDEVSYPHLFEMMYQSFVFTAE